MSTPLISTRWDFNEKQNVAPDHPVLTQRLKQAAIDWFNEAYRQYADSHYDRGAGGMHDQYGSGLYDMQGRLLSTATLSVLYIAGGKKGVTCKCLCLGLQEQFFFS